MNVHDPESRQARMAQELRYIRWALWMVLALGGFMAIKVWCC